MIAHAVWLYFRFLLNVRIVGDMLAAPNVIASHQTVRLWAEKSADTLPMISGSDQLAGSMRMKPRRVVITIGGKKYSIRYHRELRAAALEILGAKSHLHAK